MAANRALEIGKAGEHLVCADLLLKGYRAYLSDQGLPYDVIVDTDGRLIRLQVKSTLSTRNVNAQGRIPRIAYNFNARRRGKNGQSRLDINDCDVIAFVALDIRQIAYVPLAAIRTTFALMPPGKKFAGQIKRALNQTGNIDCFPIEKAIESLLI